MQARNKVLKTKEVVILCGGLGSRLRDVVADRPKPMADFNGRPFLDILIHNLVVSGIEKLILSTGYLSEVIEDNIHVWKEMVDVQVVKETELLGTGGAVKNSLSNIVGDNFFIVNGDSYCQGEMLQMEIEHRDNQADFTMLLTQVSDARAFGTVIIDENNKVQKFIEKNKSTTNISGYQLVNAGVYLCNRNALMSLPKERKFSLEYDFFPKLISKSFYGYVTEAPLYDIGTAQSYANAVKILGSL